MASWIAAQPSGCKHYIMMYVRLVCGAADGACVGARREIAVGFELRYLPSVQAGAVRVGH